MLQIIINKIVALSCPADILSRGERKLRKKAF